MSNPIIFVSLGPGEPDLITLKGLKALQNADCIFCPETRTTSGRILSRAADILHALNIPNTTLSRFALPMSKNREQAFAAYDKVYSEASLLHKENKKSASLPKEMQVSILPYTISLRNCKPTIFLCNTLPVSPPSLQQVPVQDSTLPARRNA